MKPFNHPDMKTQAQLKARYGDPTVNQKEFEKKWMVTWQLPKEIHSAIPSLPLQQYTNNDIVKPLISTLSKLILEGLHHEIKHYDGCFVVRKQRGSKSISMHSYGIAMDINAAWNPLNGKISWTDKFLDVWRSKLWICGADFKTRKDGMHFEWTAKTAF